MLGAAIEGVGLAQLPAPIAAESVIAKNSCTCWRGSRRCCRCVSLLSWPPANDAEATSLHRSREEPFARHTARQNENFLTAQAIQKMERVKRSDSKLLFKFSSPDQRLKPVDYFMLDVLLDVSLDASARPVPLKTLSRSSAGTNP